MNYVPLQFGVEYLNSQNSGFWDSLYLSTEARAILELFYIFVWCFFEGE